MLLVDMKMPKGCVECPFSRYSLSGISCGLIEGKTLFRRDDVINKRSPSDICPLREIKDEKGAENAKTDI